MIFSSFRIVVDYKTLCRENFLLYEILFRFFLSLPLSSLASLTYISFINSKLLRIDTGSISVDNIVDSINNINLSIMRLNNSIYDSSKLDVVIISREKEVYFN